ncbi:MAG: hypothetical protein HFJ12_04495 [Bacilli bacterium]|nr:hypothetical protein [Bacilli bacterium]
MEEKFELLEQVYHDASMGSYIIEKLLEQLKEKDNKIKGYLEEVLKEYQQYQEEAGKILKENNKEPDNPGWMSKMGSAMGISKEVKADNSDSAIADMMIKGVSTGSIEIEKKLKEYEQEIDKEHKKLARNYLKFQQKAIQHLKEYL